MTVDVFILEELSYFLFIFLSFYSRYWLVIIRFVDSDCLLLLLLFFLLGLPSVPECSDTSLLHTFSKLEVYLVN